MTDVTKRNTLKALSIGAASLGVVNLSACSNQLLMNSSNSDKDWDKEIAQIKKKIKAPSFPDQDFDITEYGGIGDGNTDCTQAFKLAIEAASKAGGGRVVVPSGVFKTGAIHLDSNINLHISKGATVSFYTDPERYKPYVFTRWEGLELIGYSPLIYAFRKKNIAITGQGTVMGNGSKEHWWPWKGKWKKTDWVVSDTVNQKVTRDALMKMAEEHVPVEQRVFETNYLRPPFIQPYLCENVLIEGITVKDSPFWCVNPVLCTNVTVSKVHLDSYGPNSDGCNPESCNNVLIEHCIFDTGDDCIAIKSGRNADGRRVDVPCQNLIIENCQMKAGHGGVVIGSEISGGVRNVYAQNCEMSSPDLSRGIRIKTNSVRGGVLENLNYRDINIGQVKDAIVINFFYEEGDAGQFKPIVRDLNIKNLNCEQASRAFVIRGYDHTPITGINFENLNFKNVAKDSQLENIKDVQQKNIMVNGKSFTI
ncbi:glycoside hydrolase family 28 protein [Catenovulum maritimum]|uniref:Glycoside hydrolase n=1 Tax=Catenovulum maritimum TaxID=1513271 RepID=A0A0J8GSS9_9ALTE|nr:glycoside hydrolase family 28 protein [Catenovulum maritimum]KMT63758.1 glycoside hydrolase [Catenovulum maritimum]